jgi:pre-mRNA-processing factor 19
VAAGTIPGLLGALGSEWDALMQETFTLRRTLEGTREELSQALYQHEAACRVIARLVRERDQLRGALSSAQAALASRPAMAAAADASSSATSGMAVEGGAASTAGGGGSGAGISEDVLAAIRDRSKELSKARRKRALPAGSAAAAEVSALSLQHTYTPHSPSTPGVTALAAVNPATACPELAGRAQMVLTGGADRSVLLYDTAKGAVAARLEGATSRGSVTALSFHPSRDVLLSGGGDGAVRVWSNVSVPPPAGMAVGGSYAAAHTLRPHSRDVVALAVHPAGEYAVSLAREGAWAVSDIAGGRVLSVVAEADATAAGVGFTSGGLHPDGLLLCGGCGDGAVRVYDLREMKRVAELPQPGGGPITALAFSENGYTMATGSGEGLLRLWDLRKVSPVRALLQARPAATAAEAEAALAGGAAGAGVSALAFDFSGQFLASGGADGSVVLWHAAQDYAPLLTPARSDGAVTGVAWARGGRTLYTTSMDRTLRVYGTGAAGAAE